METIEQIKEDEGYSATVYLCTKGKMSWLWGRNIEDRPITNKEWRWLKEKLASGETQKDWADMLFYDEIHVLKREMSQRGFHYYDLPKEVKAIIFNMAYNMGLTSFNKSEWPNFFRAIEARQWKQAAVEGRDSKWWRKDVRTRAERLMSALENAKEA